MCSRRPLLAVLLVLLVGCKQKTSQATAPAPPASADGPTATASSAPPPVPMNDATTDGPAAAVTRLTGKSVALPGATGPAFLDYIFYEPSASRVWVPVGSTGSVDVLDTVSLSFTRVDGFKTVERSVADKKRSFGPSAGAVGEAFAYIGNRATDEVCPVNLKTLKLAKCTKLGARIDGVAYVESTKEVWVTMPEDHALTVLDAGKPPSLAVKALILTDGVPEGYAVDEGHGVFFTNLEDKGGTVAIDIKTHTVKATWNPSCGKGGPRGIAFDAAHDFAVVACTDHVQVLDAGHEGLPLGKLYVGAGIDNIDLRDDKIYVAAGTAATLTVLSIDEKGALTAVASGESSDGARNAVVDAKGNAYVADSKSARLLVFPGPRRDGQTR
jgi:hypothetical protein